MFNRGITELLRALPEFGDLDQRMVRRLLSAAYADTLDLRAQVTDDEEGGPFEDDLARLSLALETHAVLAPTAERQTVRACAFVAAECIALLAERREPQGLVARPRLERRRYRLLEAGLLYVIAGYDANAAVIARALRSRPILEGGSAGFRHASLAAEYAVAQVRAFLRLARPAAAEAPSDDPDLPVQRRVRAELWRRLGDAAQAQLMWLRGESDASVRGAEAILGELIAAVLDEEASEYADIALLARLLLAACDETNSRALRGVPGPRDDAGFAAYLARRSAERPLLWPAAQEYADRCLRGDVQHAVIAVPTGAGKSGVAELAIAHELHKGWVLYLAPTNALVAQVRRDLSEALEAHPNVDVRGFVGGAELSSAVEEALGEMTPRQVLVMTPEKCSLALRQAPEVFQSLAMCILDECHLIADRGTRGVLAELVIAHVLSLAESVRVLLMSALMDNPEELATWLQVATDEKAGPIREPWRPTRTLRAVLGFESEAFQPRHAAAEELRQEAGKKAQSFTAPVSLLAGLQGAWDGTDEEDFVLVPTLMEAPLEAQPGSIYYSSNDALAAVAAGLARQQHRVLAFIPRNRHWAFSVGATIDLSAQTKPRDEATDAHLALAEHELGVSSRVGDLLDQGVAVHTGALLDAERRACERAFGRGLVPLILATGTLAQGLNLPATAVVIAGTQVGHDPSLTPAQRRERARIQLLNAVGRAGRPRTAARSLAVVVPEKPLLLQGPQSSTSALRAVPFYGSEDAAAPVHSRLDVLIDRALRQDMTGDDMTVEELAAFAVLPLDAPDLDPGDVVRRTFGAFERNAATRESAAVIAGALGQLGERFLGDRPRWVAEAAYLAGLTVQQTLALHDGFLDVELGDRADPSEWVDATLLAMSDMRHNVLGGIFLPEALNGTTARRIFTASRGSSDAGASWDALRAAAGHWLAGATYSELAVALVGPGARGNTQRHQRAPLPKVVRVVNEVFGFGLTRAVGGLVALHQAGSIDDDNRWRLAPEAKQALELAPLAVRYGCGDVASLAWARFAGVPRRLAHVISRQLEQPSETSDLVMASWVSEHRPLLLERSSDSPLGLSPADYDALAAWQVVSS